MKNPTLKHRGFNGCLGNGSAADKFPADFLSDMAVVRRISDAPEGGPLPSHFSRLTFGPGGGRVGTGHRPYNTLLAFELAIASCTPLVAKLPSPSSPPT